MTKVAHNTGWYGKLPSAGDFVGRGLRGMLLERVEEWVGGGMIQLRHRFPDWQYLFANTPIWCCVLPPGALADEPLLGCVSPSADRVGRHFPIVALRGLASAHALADDLPPAGRWHSAIAELISDAHAGLRDVNTFDHAFAALEAITRPQPQAQTSGGDIFAVLGNASTGAACTAATPELAVGDQPGRSFGFSWPELPMLFEVHEERSFWWTVGGANTKRLAHDGPLTAHLFVTLFTQGLPLAQPTLDTQR